MVKPHLRDIQYLHIKISKDHKELIKAWMLDEDCLNISDFVRRKLLGLARAHFAQKKERPKL
jgi:hypothetical protein